jgi:hypothetical protein
MNHSELQSKLYYNREEGSFYWMSGKQAGHVSTKDGYRRISFNDSKYLAHRLAWFYVYREWPQNNIDHINGNKDDNRIENLRDVTQGVNLQNMKKVRTTSGFVGVHKGRRSKYRARIRVAGVQLNLGEYHTPEEAHQAYLAAKEIYHEAS